MDLHRENDMQPRNNDNDNLTQEGQIYRFKTSSSSSSNLRLLKCYYDENFACPFFSRF